MDVNNVVLVKKFEEKLNNFGRVIITKHQLKRDLTFLQLQFQVVIWVHNPFWKKDEPQQKKTKKRFRGFNIVNY